MSGTLIRGMSAPRRWRATAVGAIVAVAATMSSLVMLPVAGASPASVHRHAATPLPPVGSLHGARLGAAAVHASTTGQAGYWLGASDGGVYAYGAGNLGQVRGTPLNRPVVGLAATPNGGGYWLVASDGGIFSYGDARFFGSTGNLSLNKPIVGMASTPDGGGYWLVASDGGIFAYGDAHFYGSTGNLRLNKPIVGMTATRDGGGYWMVASDGGIFAFGDATFLGSTGAQQLNKPVVGMAVAPTGTGYWLVASDGGIFSYGSAAFAGSTGGSVLNQPIVGMAAAPNGGYWLVATDGGLFSFGSAPFLGSTGANPGPAPIVGMASTGSATVYPAGVIGTDISFPQCAPGGYPPAANPVAIVGVNGGLSNTVNPCFAAEAANAGPNLTVYLNTDPPQLDRPQAVSGPAGTCQAMVSICTGYNWGFNKAQASIAYVHAAGFTPQVWWLDVEGPCTSSQPIWACGPTDLLSNAAVIQGAIDAIHGAGLVAGIYSTYYQWPLITGGTAGADTVNYPGLPIWIAWAPADITRANVTTWLSICSDSAFAFAGGTPWLVQWLGGGYNGKFLPPTAPLDGDLACPISG